MQFPETRCGPAPCYRHEQVSRSTRGHGSGAGMGDERCVDDGQGHTGRRVVERDKGELAG